jgi:hypothetical protein
MFLAACWNSSSMRQKPVSHLSAAKRHSEIEHRFSSVHDTGVLLIADNEAEVLGQLTDRDVIHPETIVGPDDNRRRACAFHFHREVCRVRPGITASSSIKLWSLAQFFFTGGENNSLSWAME